jgi:serine/threonine-protein kinase
VRDVEASESGVELVMDWVEGASLSDLIRAWQKEPPASPAAVAIRIALDTCAGLRALHELADEQGKPLGCVHRDVSPANVLVGVDGVARITDFGLARPLLAVERTTSEGALRGKLGYMAPEYILGRPIDARVDVFAMGVVLWEALARKRLFRGENDAETLERVQRHEAAPLAIGAAGPPLDALLARALAKDPASRMASIAELATELERIAREYGLLASHDDVRAAFGSKLRADIDARRREVERALSVAPVPPALPPKPVAARALLAAAATVVGIAAIAFVATRERSRAAPPNSASAAPAPIAPSASSPPAAPPGIAVGDLPNASPTMRPARPNLPRKSAEPPAPSPPDGKSPRPNPYASAEPR